MMQWRLVLALLVSVLLHASLLLPLGDVRVKASRKKVTELTVHLRNQPVSAPATAGDTDMQTSDAASDDAPAAEEDSPLPQEVRWVPSLPSSIAQLGPQQDQNWYRASEVSVRAQPLGVIESPDLALYGGELPPGRAVLDIYIDEFGVTDHVDIVLVSPPGRFDERVTANFLSARWSPAVRDGRYVRSVKSVELCVSICDGPPASYNGEGTTGGDGR